MNRSTQYQISVDNRQAMLILCALRVAEDMLPTADRWRLQQTHNDVANQLNLES